MKRSELSQGQIIAYKTRRVDRPSYIYKATITDLGTGQQPVTVAIETNSNVRRDTLQLWQILGDYNTVKAEHDLWEANKTIHQLKQEIATKERSELIRASADLLNQTLEIPAYRIRNSYTRDEIALELSQAQFRNLVNTIKDNKFYQNRIEHLLDHIDALNASTKEAVN